MTEQAGDQAPQTLMAELCFAQAPLVDAADILHRVRQARPDADLTIAEGSLIITYGLLCNMYPDARRAPLLNAITRPVPDGQPRDISQCAWDRAAEVLATCRYSLLVTEFLGRDVAVSDRLEAYQTALAAVIGATGPQVVWWPGSGQAVPPGEVSEDPLVGLINVRIFADPADPDVALMDTLGLSQLGLPDLQCHFRYLDRDLMRGLLHNAARFQFQHGPLTEAVRGFTQHQRWPVHPAESLAGPARPMITIDPGEPFSGTGGDPGVRQPRPTPGD